MRKRDAPQDPDGGEERVKANQGKKKKNGSRPGRTNKKKKNKKETLTAGRNVRNQTIFGPPQEKTPQKEKEKKKTQPGMACKKNSKPAQEGKATQKERGKASATANKNQMKRKSFNDPVGWGARTRTSGGGILTKKKKEKKGFFT